MQPTALTAEAVSAAGPRLERTRNAPGQIELFKTRALVVGMGAR